MEGSRAEVYFDRPGWPYGRCLARSRSVGLRTAAAGWPAKVRVDDLSDLSDSPASYLALLALVALDTVFPVAPSETLLVTGGI
jgi:hypothetical protein